jgi:hypothetical protein
VNKLLSVDIIYVLLIQVRLLTGVGRYTEMNYIFQILKDNEQFEFLLGKGLDKVTLVIINPYTLIM